MKIALVHHLGPGGALRAAGALAQGLVARGHELQVHALEPLEPWPIGALPAELPRVWAGQFMPDPWPRPWPLVGPLLRARWWDRELRRLRQAYEGLVQGLLTSPVDLAWVHHDRLTQAPFVLELLAGRLPTLYQCHEPLRRAHEAPLQGPGQVEEPRSSWRAWHHGWWAQQELAKARALDRRLALSADGLLANSRYSCEVLLRTYGRVATWIPMGVDLAAFQPLALPREDAVLVVGRLGPLKGQELVVEALGRLPAEDRPVLWLVGDAGGDPAFQGRLLARAEALGLAWKLELDLPEAELRQRYARATLMVAPMVLEPFGLVALEAQAMETPVVAVAEAGLREAVHHGVGGLWVPRDAEALAQAIQGLRHRPERARALGVGGRAWVQAHHSWRPGTLALEAAAERLVGSWPRP